MNLIHMNEENDYHNGCLDINISKWKHIFCEEKVNLGFIFTLSIIRGPQNQRL